jgi:probable addiction module antidote protein
MAKSKATKTKAKAKNPLGPLVHALGVVARARGGMSKLAKETGISRQGLYKAIAKDGNPSFETVMKIVGAFGVRLSAQAA